jgi:hypothetical protein
VFRLQHARVPLDPTEVSSHVEPDQGDVSIIGGEIMSSLSLPTTKIGSLAAAVWVASALAAWTMELKPDEMGIVLIVVFFFRFVPMVATIGSLYGRPTFVAIMGVAALCALAGIEIANILIGLI